MSHVELDSFFSKFKFLCCYGYNASLKVENVAGEATVILEAGPFPVPAQPFNYRHQVRRHLCPAQQCRRERREAARRAAAVAQNQLNDQELEAEEVTNDDKETVNEATVVETVAATDDSATATAEEAVAAVPCDLCDSKFRNIRGLKTHKGRVHKEIIPQFDGAGEEPETQCVYTFVSTFAEEDVEYTLKEVLSNDIKTDII